MFKSFWVMVAIQRVWVQDPRGREKLSILRKVCLVPILKSLF